jgi:pyruvate/2-oxoglutarate dehydrogenase complex dihydrolipoamide acyltransferase (E2) component
VTVIDVRVDEALWGSSMLPEGFVERWFVTDGTLVSRGDRIAEVRIEDSRHEITAPVSGWLLIAAKVNAIVEPGALLARLTTDTEAQRESGSIG